MPTSNEISHRESDERRVRAENARSAAAAKAAKQKQRAVLRTHLTELSHHRSDLDRQVSETTREISRLG